MRVLPALAISYVLISQPATAGIGSFLASAGRIGQEMDRQRYEQSRRQLELERIRLCNEIIRLGGQCSAPQTSAIDDERLYERASFTGRLPTGDRSINTCNYKTANGYTFYVNYRGSCPYSVRVNPVTNWVLFD